MYLLGRSLKISRGRKKYIEEMFLNQEFHPALGVVLRLCDLRWEEKAENKGCVIKPVISVGNGAYIL